MGFWGTKKNEDEPEPESIAPPAAPALVMSRAPVPTSNSRPAGTPPDGGPARVGIDHAILLMRSLPTQQNVELVVAVLKTTLESLNIHVVDIVADAAKRLKEIESRVAQLRSEITGLQQEIATRAQEIARMEASHAETTKVKEYLETDKVDLVEDKES